MEVCLADDNSELERLVTGATFDRDLALKLARHEPWGTWGFKEYWDVLETVWRLNQAIAPNQKRMRLIGLESRFDQQSLAMTMGEDSEGLRTNVPWWENLRRFRLLSSVAKVDARDVQMAARIEREIIQKGERGIVWVGQAHAHACPAFVSKGQRFSRMGALLRQKHGADVFFIWLHGPDTALSAALEAVMNQSGLAMAGFDTRASPLGLWRDTSAFDYQFEPRLELGDMADGYVYLKPWDELSHCTWLSGYISPAMFTANKPFYQAWGQQVGHPVNSAAEANAFQDTWLRENVKKLRKLPDNEKYASMTAEEAAQALLDAFGREDWIEAEKFLTSPVEDSFKQVYGRVKLLSLGQPLAPTVGDGGARRVPYEIQFNQDVALTNLHLTIKKGQVEKGILVLKKDPATGRWYVDGGI
jgi:hypothetical protein